MENLPWLVLGTCKHYTISNTGSRIDIYTGTLDITSTYSISLFSSLSISIHNDFNGNILQFIAQYGAQGLFYFYLDINEDALMKGKIVTLIGGYKYNSTLFYLISASGFARRLHELDYTISTNYYPSWGAFGYFSTGDKTKIASIRVEFIKLMR